MRTEARSLRHKRSIATREPCLDGPGRPHLLHLLLLLLVLQLQLLHLQGLVLCDRRRVAVLPPRLLPLPGPRALGTCGNTSVTQHFVQMCLGFVKKRDVKTQYPCAAQLHCRKDNTHKDSL